MATEPVTLLERLRELDEKAIPAPWYCIVNDLVGGKAVATVDKPMSQFREREARVPADLTSSDDDAALIAELRNALPAVVALIEAAQRHIAEEVADIDAINALAATSDSEAERLAQQHQRGTRQRANEAFAALCIALAAFVSTQEAAA